MAGEDEQRVVDANGEPSIAASAITVEVSSVIPLAIWMPSAPTPTPMSAVSSGRPAAMSDPKVIVSTSTATSTPSTSPIGGSLSTAAAEPPYWTCSPAFAAERVAASMASVWDALTSACLIVNCRSVYAMRPSLETAAVLNGSEADATSGTPASCLTACATAALPSPEFSD